MFPLDPSLIFELEINDGRKFGKFAKIVPKKVIGT